MEVQIVQKHQKDLDLLNKGGKRMSFFKKQDDFVTLFLRRIEDIIDESLKDEIGCDECKRIIMNMANSTFKNTKKDYDPEHIKLIEPNAYKYIYNTSFSLVSSGQFHIYRGVLNPMGVGPLFIKLINVCLDYYEKNGIVDKAQREDQIDILNENIASVG